MRKLPESLDDLLLISGIPLGEIAKKAKIDQRSLRDLRAGLVGRPRIKTVSGLATALGVNPRRVLQAILASRAARG